MKVVWRIVLILTVGIVFSFLAMFIAGLTTTVSAVGSPSGACKGEHLTQTVKQTSSGVTITSGSSCVLSETGPSWVVVAAGVLGFAGGGGATYLLIRRSDEIDARLTRRSSASASN